MPVSAPHARPAFRRPRPIAAALLLLGSGAGFGFAAAQPPAAVPATPAAAQQSAGSAAPTDTVAVIQVGEPADSAVLVLRNRPVAVFRAPLGVLTPAERAAAASARLLALADTLADLPDDSAAAVIDAVRSRTVPGGMIVLARGRGMFTLTAADLDPVAGESLPQTALLAVANVRSALQGEREARSLPHLLRAAALALLATVAFVVLLRLVRGARRWALVRLPRRAGARVPTVSVGGFTLFSGDQLLTVARRALDLAAWGGGLFAAYLWLAFVLTRFAYSRPWGEALGAYLRMTVGELLLSAVSGVPGLFTVVLIVVATRWVSRLVGGFFDAVEAGTVEQPWVHPETASATKRLAIALLWLLAVVVAYPYVPGSGSDVFKGVSVFAGLVLSLGSSGVMNQAMSGLVLMYSRALKPGEYVRVGEIEGTVTALGMLSTKIRTTKREEVTLPNAVIVAANVKNYSRLCVDGGTVIVHTAVTIGYDVPWRQVEGMLLAAAARTEGLLGDPPPFVLKTGLADFYVEYQLNAHLAVAERRVPALSALHANIVDVFNEHGVQILSPHHVADPATPAVVPRERWHADPAPPGLTHDARG